METDDCFQERLIYSDSEHSDIDETNDPVTEPSTTQLTEDCSLPVSKEPTDEKHSDSNHLSADSDEDDFNKSIKVKKNARILSSDDDDGDNNEPQINEIETQFDVIEENTVEHQQSQPQTKINVRPSICDSDSSDGNESVAEKPATKPVEKLKKKKKKIKGEQPRRRVIINQSDSESNDENKDEPKKKEKAKSTKRKNVSDQSSSSSGTGSGSGSNSTGSASDSNASGSDNETSDVSKSVVKPREKTTAQRVFIERFIKNWIFIEVFTVFFRCPPKWQNNK